MTERAPSPQAELAAFLRAKRARLQPEDVGLPRGPRRRTPGLRRQEVAQLAAVSVEWYVRLEQGRVGTPGSAVLDALAEALRLTPDEHRHLHLIARRETPVRPAARPPHALVRDSLRQLLDGIPLFPAYLTDHRLDVLAHNPAARALFGPGFGTGPTDNTARMLFLDPATRATQLDWPRVARETVGHLRTAAAHHPDDPRLTALLTELRSHSPEFTLWWDDHTVLDRATGTKRVRHPEAGDLRLHYDILTTGPHRLFTLTPADPATDRALRHLVTTHTAALTATHPTTTVRPITAA
ncbi:helix-turn-helix transcriptional regulator [Kitasatospora sp. YST-16]|uniref:helix-turn-helix domain-containing protein n=1 Tax=Kitasatospora sp. YST-16 TaxID=2998080 RepID=UPI002283AC60|nr:helix-turn-helix transcriptional regulator [Kitasatospora sp. YST-16]WAL74501.1 helix-turn-helix transcriptional regulator [Kitasatospora sp. YST-16]WNW40565.1 helix-turn-helix transcriptional regulator [Streptomyces sp. Li-HN-5-13]